MYLLCSVQIFLNRYKTTLNFKRQVLSVNVQNLKIEIPFNSPEMSLMCVPARTEMTMYLDVRVKQPQVILSEQIKPHVFIANSIVNPTNGKIPVKILNVSRKPVFLNELKLKMETLDEYEIIQLEAFQGNPDRAKKLLNELKLDHLDGEEKSTIKRICLKYNDIFCLKNDKLIVTKVLTPSISVKNNTKPVYTKPYRLPYAQTEEIEKQIDSMKKVV